MSSVSITENARRRIAEICGDKPFRIGVDGGACQGFQYVFDITSELGEDDEVLDFDGIRIVVDRISIPYLLGSELDYVSSLVGERFEVSNPNATSTCGCGTSFSV